MGRKLLLTFAIVLFSVSLSAQHNQFEFGAKTGLGVSWVSVDLDEFSTRPGLNFNALGFANYFFSEYRGVTGCWGASMGLGVNRYSSSLDLGNYNTVFSEGSDPTSDYERLLYSHAWQEDVSLTTLSIPLGVIYKISFSRSLDFRSLLGLNIELPLASSYKRGKGSLSTRLYYPDFMMDPSEAIIDVPEFYSYEQRTDWDNASGSLAHKLDLSLYLEAGILYRLSRKFSFTDRRVSLTADLYMGLGLNSATKNKNTQLMEIVPSDGCKYHSPTSFASTRTLHTGIKLGFIFGGKKRYYFR